MSIKRRQLFVGIIPNEHWTREKLCDYFAEQAGVDSEHGITECRIMSYREPKFQGTSFAFITFTDSIYVDRCMAKREHFIREYGITIKRLLPDSIPKCERQVSSEHLVIRLSRPDLSFNESNIRDYFGSYGKIVDLKMLDDDEKEFSGTCFLTFADFDSVDRILLDKPHHLNGQDLSLHKYVEPDHICQLSQFAPDAKPHSMGGRWYSIFRNLTDFVEPLRLTYKTQLALTKDNVNKRLTTATAKVDERRQALSQLERIHRDLKQEMIDVCHIHEKLRNQIDETMAKNEQRRIEFEQALEKQRTKNKILQDAIVYIQENGFV